MLNKANVRGLLAGLGLAGALVLIGSSCNQSILTAPPDSTISMIANPTFIPAFGGVSEITAIVYDATGQPVPDGTVVQFFTDLGRVDEQGRTNDGVARVNLVADGRSGTAHVKGIIGGGSIPSSNPSATATPSTAAMAGAQPMTLALTSASRTITSVAAVPGSADVTIGSANPKTVVLAGDPRNIASDAPRYSTLTATVFDERGNPIANVPVVFRIVTDADFTESLESGGRPTFTDTNGQARDRLWTALPRSAPPQQAGVEAVVVTTNQITSEPVFFIGINF